MMQQDGRARIANQQQLRELKRDYGRAVRVMSSHDAMEFERAAHHPVGEPAGISESIGI
jgi:hypothetical protein